MLKQWVKRHSVLRRLAELVWFPVSKAFFGSSGDYWETRYVKGGTSGTGSYGRLAEFKARVLNDFVEQNDVETTIELGCGDGAQLSTANYPRYVGVDVSRRAVEICREKYANKPDWQFFLASDKQNYKDNYDLALSLDVIYHLVEDRVYQEYIEELFSLSCNFVIIYSSDEENISSMAHVRHRNFSKYVENNIDNWVLVKKIPNQYPLDPDDMDETSFADFFIYERAPDVAPTTI